MPSRRNRKSGNMASGNAVSTDAKSNIQQVNNSLETSAGNEELNHPVIILEESLTAQQDKENVQIKQLQNKIEELEKQVTQYKIQIKDLEDKVLCK